MFCNTSFNFLGFTVWSELWWRKISVGAINFCSGFSWQHGDVKQTESRDAWSPICTSFSTKQTTRCYQTIYNEIVQRRAQMALQLPSHYMVQVAQFWFFPQMWWISRLLWTRKQEKETWNQLFSDLIKAGKDILLPWVHVLQAQSSPGQSCQRLWYYLSVFLMWSLNAAWQ